ncbi:hypothetical protein [Staphylococcus shinii]|uniref:hypothetical protein n=1 Tax=Staphylococcus shinii TaxID=2912228 RepID=UPI003F83DA8C
MNKRQKMDIELEKFDISKWDHLSNKNIHKIKEYKKHLKSLSRMCSIMTILLLLMNFIYNFQYSEYVFLIISIITLMTTIYIVISVVKSKKIIKYSLFPKERLQEYSNSLKVRIYRYKSIDRADLVICLIMFLWSIYTIIENGVIVF